MNYLLIGLLIVVILVLMFVVFYLYNRFFKNEKSVSIMEPYIEKRNEKISIQPMEGASPEVNDLLAELNKTGNQMVADAVYDNVDMSVLEENN